MYYIYSVTMFVWVKKQYSQVDTNIMQSNVVNQERCPRLITSIFISHTNRMKQMPFGNWG